jgi:hypothetical protein
MYWPACLSHSTFGEQPRHRTAINTVAMVAVAVTEIKTVAEIKP